MAAAHSELNLIGWNMLEIFVSVGRFIWTYLEGYSSFQCWAVAIQNDIKKIFEILERFPQIHLCRCCNHNIERYYFQTWILLNFDGPVPTRPLRSLYLENWMSYKESKSEKKLSSTFFKFLSFLKRSPFTYNHPTPWKVMQMTWKCHGNLILTVRFQNSWIWSSIYNSFYSVGH